MLTTGRFRHPQVFTDLNAKHQVRHVARTEQEIGAERHLLAMPVDVGVGVVPGVRKPALLIKFCRVRQIDLRHDPQHRATTQHNSAVKQPPVVFNRGSDDEGCRRLSRKSEQLIDRASRGVKQAALIEKIGTGVATDAKLGKQKKPAIRVLFDNRANRAHIECNIGHLKGRAGYSNAKESEFTGTRRHDVPNKKPGRRPVWNER